MTQTLMDFGSEILLFVQVALVYWMVKERRKFTEECNENVAELAGWFQKSNGLRNKRLIELENRLSGVTNKATLKAKTAEVLADRAFNLASSANLAIMALQRTLTVRPTHIPKKKQLENEVAQENVMKIIGGTSDYSGFDWLRPILGPDEIDLIDKAMEHAERFQNGEKDS